MTGVVRAPDGVPIAYDVRGQGETTLLFIHCWACDRSYWRGQLDVFARDWRVVSLDLGGHGASGAERAAWSIKGLAGDVVAVADALGLRRMILVGHSMGGPVALEAARRLGGRVVGVVGVDNLHDAERKMPAEFMARTAQRFEADFVATMTDFIRSMFPPGTDPGVASFILSKATSANRKVALALFRDFANLDLPGALSAVKVPIRCVNAAPRPPSGPPTAVATNRKYADFDAVLLDGVGHFLMLEKPAEFNAKLREVLAPFK
jgi:pimeloyl-ACP methyl ester carboxylesterase